jgi:hypothetical protein
MSQHAQKNARLDRIAAIQRFAGVLLLLPGRGASSLHWLVVGGATVGGAVLYHVLTSVRYCVHCGASIAVFAIRKPGPLGKRFSCTTCGQHTDSKEGFVCLYGS